MRYPLRFLFRAKSNLPVPASASGHGEGAAPAIAIRGVAAAPADAQHLAAHPPQGICPVCCHHTQFKGFNDNLRESGLCAVCGSFNRQRQMAWMLRHRLPMADQVGWSFRTPLAIYNTESTGALHQHLLRTPDYQFSEYFGPEFKGGDTVRGIRHENLQQLSFPDERFDVVMSSDVMEHMPEPYTAHREIFRVLKPGGRHIFTVPFDIGMSRDDVRAEIVNGEVVYHGEKLYHGDPVRPDEGILVWTIFGQQMLPRLNAIGFRTSALLLHEPESGILGDNALVFEAVKP